MGPVPERVYWPDVPVQRLQVLEGLVLAHHLHQRGDHGVGGAAGRGVGHLDVALVLGLEQVGPGLGHGQLLLGQQLGVVAEAQRARVDADRLVARLPGLLLRPRMQLRQRGRLVFEREALLGRLQVRVAGAAEPDVGLGVVLLGDELGQRLARALERHVDLGARGARVHGGDHVAPLGLHRADDVDLALRGRAAGAEAKKLATSFCIWCSKVTELHRRGLASALSTGTGVKYHRGCTPAGPGPRMKLSYSRKVFPQRTSMSFDLVLFGGTGDLAWRKLMPALFQAFRHGTLPPAAASSAWRATTSATTQYRELIRSRFDAVDLRQAALAGGVREASPACCTSCGWTCRKPTTTAARRAAARAQCRHGGDVPGHRAGAVHQVASRSPRPA
jgi:hypothetical protein